MHLGFRALSGFLIFPFKISSNKNKVKKRMLKPQERLTFFIMGRILVLRLEDLESCLRYSFLVLLHIAEM